MTLNKEKLKDLGFDFGTTEDLYFYISEMVDWLESHNKNYTAEQYSRIVDIKDLLDCIE